LSNELENQVDEQQTLETTDECATCDKEQCTCNQVPNQEFDASQSLDPLRTMRNQLLEQIHKITKKPKVKHRDVCKVLGDISQLLLLQEDALRNLVSDVLVAASRLGHLTTESQQYQLFVGALFKALQDYNVLTEEQLKTTTTQVFQEYVTKQQEKFAKQQAAMKTEMLSQQTESTESTEPTTKSE
jgi:hypothetical protein